MKYIYCIIIVLFITNLVISKNIKHQKKENKNNSQEIQQPGKAGQCLDGQFYNYGELQCQNCSEGCKVCENTKYCDQCANNYYEHERKCISTCPETYYGSIVTHKCEKCDIFCLKCKGPSDKECTQCIEGLILENGQCIAECDFGLYADLKLNKCMACEHMCANCTGTGFNCTVCKDKTHYLIENTGECIKNCPIFGYFAEKSSKMCKQCHSSCKQCVGNTARQCQDCYPGFDLVDFQCVSQCQTGLYYDELKEQCQKCHETCLTCKGPFDDECIYCKEGLELNLVEQCVKPEDKNKIIQITEESINLIQETNEIPFFNEIEIEEPVKIEPYENETQKKFEQKKEPKKIEPKKKEPKINESKLRAEQNQKNKPKKINKEDSEIQQKMPLNLDFSGSLGVNLERKKSKFLEENTIKKEIPQQLIQQSNKCQSGTFLNGDECLNQCPDFTYSNSELKICLECPDNCQKCNGQKIGGCQKCGENTFMFGFDCVLACPSHYFADQGSKYCIECDKNCLECNGSGKNNCIACTGGNFLINGKCEVTCPEQFLPDTDSNQCVTNKNQKTNIQNDNNYDNGEQKIKQLIMDKDQVSNTILFQEIKNQAQLLKKNKKNQKK